MKTYVAQSNDIDTEDAAEELVSKSQQQLAGVRPRLAILFAAIDFEFQIILDRLRETWPEMELIGCTTDGELSSENGFAEDSVVLLLFAGEDFDFATGVARGVSSDPNGLIRDSIRDALSRLGSAPQICLVTPTSMTVSESAILRAISNGLGEGVPIFGGTSGDQWRFQGSWQFYGGEFLQDSVPYILFGDGVLFSFGVETGWHPLGREARATAVEGNILKSIDNEPATDFYRHYLGNVDINHLGEYPLAIFPDESNDFYLRSSIHTNEAEGWLYFVGDIPENARLQITQTTRDEVLGATAEALNEAFESYPGEQPSALLCFSCAARKQVLGTRTDEEYDIVRQKMPELITAGFYGYGELSPVRSQGPSLFHNETFVALLLGSR